MKKPVQSPPVPRPWPKLSETLDGPRHPRMCQGCGAEHDAVIGSGAKALRITLLRWQECDENDQPTPVIVVLCRSCSDALVEAHPRLYRQVSKYQPLPGTMDLCAACRHRDGLRCAHPDLRANGGIGLEIRFPQPEVAFVDGIKDGRRFGYRQTLYTGPPTSCAGREVAGPHPDDQHERNEEKQDA